MRSTWLATLSFLAVTSIASLASADVAPRCKCSTPGIATQGGLAAVMAMAGAGTLLVLRSRRKS
jgi:MYXO-CTERM domain-containing protein